MKIDTKDLPLDLAGEVLRAFCFDTRDGIFPEISNLKRGFAAVSPFNNKLVDIANDWLDQEAKVYCFSYQDAENRIDICLQYDHDCTLIIKDGPNIYINSDAKKPYGWKEI